MSVIAISALQLRLVLCVAVLAWIAAVPVRGQGGPPVEIVVRIDTSAPAALRRSFSDVRIDPTMAREVRASKAVFSRDLPGTYVLTATDTAAARRLLTRLARTTGVRYAVPNATRRLHVAQLGGVTGAPYDSLTNYRLTGVDVAHTITTGIPQVRIGVIDTGLDLDHPAFDGQLAVNAAEDIDSDGRFTAADLNGIDDDGNGFVDDVVGYDFVDRPTSVLLGDVRQRDPNPDEDDLPGGGRGHGTIVAGILAGKRSGAFVGVAPGARLVPLRAFSSDGTAEDDDIAAAILYAAGGPNREPLDVLNLSFGDVYESPLLREAIALAVARGVVVVASAGNDGSDAPHYPSDYPGVLGVQWLSEDGTAPGFLASYGTGVDLGAPSTLIYSPRLFASDDAGASRYGRASGSSVAAPLVAGAAALLRSLDRSLGPEAIRSILTATTDDIGDPGWDHRTGAGRVRVDRALTRALPGRVEILSPRSNDGLSASPVEIVGSALDPAFASYRIDAAPGDSGDFRWSPVTAESTSPVSRDTLGRWNVSTLDEGVYTLRLVVTRTDGRTVEARQRVWIDRTAPRFRVARASAGFARGVPALLVEVETDDLTTLSGTADDRVTAASGRRARVHGLTFPLTAGSRTAELVATNTAGLSSTITVSGVVPTTLAPAGWFRESVTAIPEGTLLPRSTDFDGDGLPEVTVHKSDARDLNRDSVLVMEWTGQDFTRVHAIVGPLRPRDAGDTNGDGRGELLLTYGGATFLAEASAVRGFPDRVVFSDTTALGSESSSRTFYGSRFTDLDGDGLGEIAGHNTRQWRVLERSGTSFALIDTLRNPTGVSGDLSRNELNDAVTAYLDLDGNGQAELVTLDGDGDIVAYEVNGGRGVVRWSATTARYGFRPRFATGRFDGPRTGLIVATTTWPTTLSSREQEPARMILYHLDARDGRVAIRDSIVFEGDAQRNLALAALDVTGDGADELIVALAPDLYVLGLDPLGDWVLRDLRRETTPAVASGTRARDLVVLDPDRDGVPDLFVPMADGRTRRLTPMRSEPDPGPEGLRLAAPEGASPLGRLVVRWTQPPGADSVTVYGTDASRRNDLAAHTGFDALGTTRTDSLVVVAPRDVPRLPADVFVVAWRQGRASRPSVTVTRAGGMAWVAAHAVAVAVTTPGDPRAGYVALTFDRAVAPPTPGTIRLDGRPVDVLDVGQRDPSTADPNVLLVRDDGQAARVSWTDLRAADGTVFAPSSVAIVRTRPSNQLFVLREAIVEGRQQVRLRFSAPVDTTALNVSRYTVRPGGTVVRAERDPSAPTDVILTISGTSIGANGRPNGIVVRALRSTDGRVLDPDGGAADLSRAAVDLSALTAYPNPVRAATSPEGVMIAGLPAKASITILSPDGVLLRTLDETDADGGARWDLKDRAGIDVPSGVYLVRVTAGAESRFVRVAVLR